MTSARYQVTGMTCEHCVHAVTGELKNLGRVRDVTVTVTSDEPLSGQEVAAALDEAGDYQLAGT